MKTLILPKMVTGRISILRFPQHYRLTSYMFAGVESLDLSQGMDIFLPLAISNEKFGEKIKSCFDATRLMKIENIPKGEAARIENKKWKEKLKEWNKKALIETGEKSLMELHSRSSCCEAFRTNDIVLFLNTRQKKYNDFFSIPASDPEYREFVLHQPVRDEQLGSAARAALDAVVRSFPG